MSRVAPATAKPHPCGARFALGRYADAAERLRAIRPIAQRFGGSHAQRDVIDQTLIEAAKRAGDRALADALHRERTFLRS